MDIQPFSFLTRRIFHSTNIFLSSKMPKAKPAIKKETETPSVESPFVKNKSGNILISIRAKPGAKINSITDIGSDAVGIQINSPPVDGEANDELLKYLCRILGLKKSEVSLEKGSKSRQKTVMISKENVDVEELKQKLLKEMKDNC